MLDELHPRLPNLDRDDNTYVLGRIDQHNVVMACLPGQYGTNNAAIVATNLKRSFPNIRATLMVGIGGGSPSQADIYLGDVVVGTRVMQYDMGKVTAGGLFQETADAKTPARLLSSAVSALRSKHGIHYGVIASGNKVMKDGKAWDDIAQRLSALCFEMEAAGMMDNLQCLPIRGICGYSDSHKNKEWQAYSAATAAAYARELLEELAPSSKKLTRTPTYIANTSQPNTADDYDWLDPRKQSQHHGFLWMRGKAGAGKSTMMKFVYLETKKTLKKPGMAVASFFFNARGDYLERSISGMYRSLLLQLLQEFSDLQFVLDDTDILPWNQQGCPDLNALKELLNSTIIALGQRCFTCFVDALDECDELEVRDMVQFFEELAEIVEILNNESSHGALALRKELSEIPAKLSELFRSMLARDQQRPESLKLCILWILFAKRPLSPAEFRHALWAGLPDDTCLDAVKLVTSSSKGLAEITKSNHPTVQFIHESVRDFW
ncbi:hypothetical protein VTI74DRAFT_5460 [Chaetomium olivicolor]